MASISCISNGFLETLCQRGQLERAIDVLFGMDTPPPHNIYMSLLKACIKKKALSQAKKVEAHLAQNKQCMTSHVGDYLVMTLAKCGAVEDALKLSHELHHLTVYAWTAVISAYAERGQLWEALKLFQSMKEDGVEPNHSTFSCLLKAFGSSADLEQIRTLHAEARQMGLGADVHVCTTLVRVYGRCGAIGEAEHVFRMMSERDVVTWNAMLAAYVEQGLAHNALLLFRQMHEEEVILDQLMFVVALQACGALAETEEGQSKSMSLEIGRALHADARRKGFCSGAFLFSTLVNMYSKSGRIDYAESAFSVALSQCNSVTWNVMISAYFEHNQEGKSLQAYKRMHEEGLVANKYTFAIVLQACGALSEREQTLIVDAQPCKPMSLSLTKALHVDAQRLDFASDVFVCNTLIRIYGKCGAITEAEDVFCKLLDRDNVTWNALLSAYVEHCEGEKALLLYKQMQEEMVSPDQLAIVMVLQGCGKLAEKEECTIEDGQAIKARSLEIGWQLYDDVQHYNLLSDVAVADSLLRMYTKCGALAHAERVFVASSSQHEVRFWTAMLSAYVESDHGEKALQLYRKMLKEGVNPDPHTFVAAILGCGILAEQEKAVVRDGHPIKLLPLEIGQALHADARKMAYTPNIYINNTLVSVYGKCGAVELAEDVFSSMSERDEVSWNALLSAYSLHADQSEKILQLYRQMQAESLSPDHLTFVIALQACSNLLEGKESVDELTTKASLVEIGEALRADADEAGVACDIAINNTLVSMYGKCNNLQEAEAVFDAMCEHDTVSWTAMLSVYVDLGEGEKVVDLCTQMEKQLVTLDEITIICILQSCADIGSLEVCRQHHFTISSAGFDSNFSIASTLIHAYGNCASTMDGLAVFDYLYLPDIASWNALTASYAGEGDYESTMCVYEALHLTGNDADQVSFIAVLTACNHAGLALQGFESFECMRNECGLDPHLKHYNILVDLLARLGDFKRVAATLERMPMQADVTLWLCLMAACRIHGNLDVGKRAFDHAMGSQPRHSAAYVLMSNLYAEAGLI